MKYKETGFRAFYHHFIAVPMKKNLMAVLKDFEYFEYFLTLCKNPFITISRYDILIMKEPTRYTYGGNLM